MKTRELGRGGPLVSALGLGCMGMAGWYGVRDDGEARATIERALELGVTFLDTADVYGNGENEEFVRRAIRGRREGVFLATKCGNKFGAQGLSLDGRPDYILQACDASLKRLGVETIDLYYLHRVDPNVPIEDSMGAMAKLREAGKVRYVGLSEASGATLERAMAVCPIAALQSELSLWSRDNQSGSLAASRALGVAFVAYSPLGRGMLAGSVKDVGALPESDRRHNHPRFQGENFTRNLELVRAIADIAGNKGCTPAQLALAWVVHCGDHVIPIPGTQRRAYLEENVAALDLTLSGDELAELDRALPPGAASGPRYPQAMMETLDS